MARKVLYDDDAPKLTSEQLAQMRPASEVHTPAEFAALTAVRRPGRPKSADPKVPITIRLDAETVETFRSYGPGWQSRVSAALTRLARDGGLTRIPGERSARMKPVTKAKSQGR